VQVISVNVGLPREVIWNGGFMAHGFAKLAKGGGERLR